MKKTLLIFTLSAALAMPVLAKKPTPHVWPELGVESQIVFPNTGAIRNFEADGNDGIWVEDRHHRWYYAELQGGCQNLSFARGVGFDTGGSATFDRFSSVVVEGWKCPLVSLVTADKPLPRKERMKLRNEVRQAAKKSVAPAN